MNNMQAASEPEGKTPTAPAKRHSNLRRLIVLAVVIIAIIVAAPFGWRWFVDFTSTARTDNATLQGDIVSISSKVTGTVVSVEIEDNQHVDAGQTLVRIDPADFEIALAQAKAGLELARRQSDTTKSGINLSAAQSSALLMQAFGAFSFASTSVAAAQAGVETAENSLKSSRAKLAQAQAKLDQAERDLERYRELANEGVIAGQKLDQAETAYKVAQTDVESAKQDVAVSESKLAQAKLAVESAEAQTKQSKGVVASAEASKEQTEVQRRQFETSLAQIAVAEKTVEAAKKQLEYTTITAPSAGRIGRRAVEPGQRITAGQPLLALVKDGVWIVANFKETQIANLKPGMPVDVTVDSFRGKVFKAHIGSLSPASGATFALLPPENASGNFTKVVQRVPVKIVFEEGALAGYEDLMRPGMSAVVKVKVR
jgi:membrane fusion protein (multidrug efflux system)